VCVCVSARACVLVCVCVRARAHVSVGELISLAGNVIMRETERQRETGRIQNMAINEVIPTL
jgi:hypothetical protein